jgi:hypothetical protein
MDNQEPDILLYQGEPVSLEASPLESFFDEENPRPDFISFSPANQRGYVATWEIDKDTLFLVGITGAATFADSAAGEVEEIDLEDLFPAHAGKIKATWFWGELRIPQGKEVQYVHMGDGSIWAQDLVLEVRRGKIVGSRTVDRLR